MLLRLEAVSHYVYPRNSLAGPLAHMSVEAF